MLGLQLIHVSKRGHWMIILKAMGKIGQCQSILLCDCQQLFSDITIFIFLINVDNRSTNSLYFHEPTTSQMAPDTSCKLTIKALGNKWNLTRQIDSWQEYDFELSILIIVVHFLVFEELQVTWYRIWELALNLSLNIGKNHWNNKPTY